MTSKALETVAGILLLTGSAFAQGNILRVDGIAPEGGDGSSWTSALNNLQDAFDAAGPGDAIWVAEGVYKPDEGLNGMPGNRAATFFMRQGVEVYGRFEGHELSVDDRMGQAASTILSGDLGSDDASGILSDNSYHVVSAYGIDETSILDGFTIRAGNSDGLGTEDVGGGLYIWGPTNPVISNCVIQENTSIIDGAGAICLDGSAPRFVDCVFRDNVATQDAGAMYVALSAAPVFERCSFIENSSGRYGGAVAITLAGAPSFIDCQFVQNQAGELGGAVNVHNCDPVFTGTEFTENTADLDGGAFWGTGATLWTNCRFTGNVAGRDGGAIFTFSAPSEPMAEDCTFSSNSAGRNGGGWSSSASARLRSVTFYGNTAGGHGGGMDTTGTGQVANLEDCEFRENEATGYGGGLYHSGTGDQTLTRVSMLGNTANRGGGLYHGESALLLSECLFEENSAESKGGGLFLTNAVQGSLIYDVDFLQNSAGIVGGGMYVTNNSSPVVRNSQFFGNASDIHGGGVYNTSSEGSGGTNQSTYFDCQFVGNTALHDGAAFFNSTSVFGGTCSPVFVGCEFLANKADHHGGAVFNISFSGTSAPEFMSCQFTQNEAGMNGGAFYNKTPGHVDSYARPLLASTLFSGNIAGDDGGAFYNISTTAGPGDSNAILINTTVAFNTAGRDGGGYYNALLGGGDADTTISNSILWGNADSGLIDSSQQFHNASGTTSVTYSCVQHLQSTGNGNTRNDPRFKDALGDDLTPGTLDDNYELHNRSLVIDEGDKSILPVDIHDLDGDGDFSEALPFDRKRCERVRARRRNGAAEVDMGAYEYQPNCSGATGPSIPSLSLSLVQMTQGGAPAAAGKGKKDKAKKQSKKKKRRKNKRR